MKVIWGQLGTNTTEAGSSGNAQSLNSPNSSLTHTHTSQVLTDSSNTGQTHTNTIMQGGLETVSY